MHINAKTPYSKLLVRKGGVSMAPMSGGHLRPMRGKVKISYEKKLKLMIFGTRLKIFIIMVIDERITDIKGD